MGLKSGLASAQITGNISPKYDDVTTLRFINYGDTAMTVSHMGVEEVLAPYDAANNYAESWEIPYTGHVYDTFTLKVTFDTGSGLAVERKTTLKNC